MLLRHNSQPLSLSNFDILVTFDFFCPLRRAAMNLIFRRGIRETEKTGVAYSYLFLLPLAEIVRALKFA